MPARRPTPSPTSTTGATSTPAGRAWWETTAATRPPRSCSTTSSRSIDDHLQDRGPHPHAAVYRFAHAEEITPFAALLELPGADEPAEAGRASYTHENNDFRVSTVAPLSANIEWIVWGNGDTNIVSIPHNEVPTTVGRDCQPYEDTKNFYELEELRTCLGATG